MRVSSPGDIDVAPSCGCAVALWMGDDVIPACGGLFGDGGDVGGEEEALGDEGLGGLLDLGEVGGAGFVALGDGGARVVRGEAGGAVGGEGNKRAEEHDEFVRGAGGGGAEIPAGVGAEGDGNFGEAEAAALVAVGVDLRDEERERGAGAVVGEEGIGGAGAAGEGAGRGDGREGEQPNGVRLWGLG